MKKFLTAILFSFIFLFSACKPMTEEEQKAYREKHTKTYEVLSVYRYSKPITNNWGAVLEVKLCYSFVYVDSNGRLHTVNDFEDTNYGLTKVEIAEKDYYYIYSGGIDTYRTLYLTKETLKSL